VRGTPEELLEFSGYIFTNDRPDWDEWGLWIAAAVALRADCRRLRVGSVLMDSHHRIVGQGYNGAAPGGPSCLKGQCPRAFSDVASGSSYDTGPGACIATHAEQNALLDAGLVRARGTVVYVTEHPCQGCFKIMGTAQVSKVVWPGGSREYAT
jgi:dCMP deaminase